MPPIPASPHASVRARRDRCPGVVRPWPADDGPLVRVRLVGGELDAATLAGLSQVARTFGDGDLHLTARANLQLRGVEHGEPFLAAIEALGLLPSRAHDQARNIVVSPLSGRRGGRLDVRPVALALDAGLRAEPRAAALPGRFLFTLDDGRGDVAGRPTDLGLVALDEHAVQLRVGEGWGPVVEAGDAARAIIDLALAFLAARGDGDDAAWHVTELPDAARTQALAGDVEPDRRTAVAAEPPGPELGEALLDVPDGVLTPTLVEQAVAPGGAVVLTPWHSIVRTELLP